MVVSAKSQRVKQEETPMMQQYQGIKKDHPDSILFFRMGDFYEMFNEDAKTASKILQITLTSRNKNQSNPVLMCGIPHHSSNLYITKLLKAGKKVALCEQTEDPKLAKGLVKREVVRIITPGTALDDFMALGLEAAAWFMPIICWCLRMKRLMTPLGVAQTGK